MPFYFSDANMHDFHLFCVIFSSCFEEYTFRRLLSRWPTTSTLFSSFFKMLFFGGYFPFCGCSSYAQYVLLKMSQAAPS